MSPYTASAQALIRKDRKAGYIQHKTADTTTTTAIDFFKDLDSMKSTIKTAIGTSWEAVIWRRLCMTGLTRNWK